MQNLFKIFILFLALTIISAIMMNTYNIEYGIIDFWTRHGLFFLFFMALFPRLTLLFSSVPFGGLLWWLGLIFAPRLLVAILATVTYWTTNPILVIISWLFVLGGESSEKTVIYKKVSRNKYREPREMKNISPRG